MLNWANGTTLLGLGLARATRCEVTPGPLRSYLATGYPLAMPVAACFVIGDVVFCRYSRHWLLGPERRPLLRHELRHTYQYALLGPLFWPLYFASSAWSFLTTKNFGVRNVFEQWAGLPDGGYRGTA